jgi:hypothetical protein
VGPLSAREGIAQLIERKSAGIFFGDFNRNDGCAKQGLKPFWSAFDLVQIKDASGCNTI